MSPCGSIARNMPIPCSAARSGSITSIVSPLRAAMSRAYNPYSGFYVGAAVRTGSGGAFAGAAVENASFGLTICAEPGAIMRAYAEGDTEHFDGKTTE